eukprot:TRINITY_DN1565_c0_g1_i1.p1 TRINITY_DN1565_c0_g1~~TRINITY_DN1565_c0_g1_i1.p1  ORF type:complete len:195 (-),score=52.97 TRINITY_DN1565_c0_g1_i1:65-649(-)
MAMSGEDEEFLTLTVHQCADLPSDTVAPDVYVKVAEEGSQQRGTAAAAAAAAASSTPVSQRSASPRFEHAVRVGAAASLRIEVWYLGAVRDRCLGEAHCSPRDLLLCGQQQLRLPLRRSALHLPCAAHVPEGGSLGAVCVSVTAGKQRAAARLSRGCAREGYAASKGKKLLWSLGGHTLASLVHLGSRTTPSSV